MVRVMQLLLQAECHAITNRDDTQHNAGVMQQRLVQLAQCLSPFVLLLRTHAGKIQLVSTDLAGCTQSLLRWVWPDIGLCLQT